MHGVLSIVVSAVAVSAHLPDDLFERVCVHKQGGFDDSDTCCSDSTTCCGKFCCWQGQECIVGRHARFGFDISRCCAPAEAPCGTFGCYTPATQICCDPLAGTSCALGQKCCGSVCCEAGYDCDDARKGTCSKVDDDDDDDDDDDVTITTESVVTVTTEPTVTMTTEPTVTVTEEVPTPTYTDGQQGGAGRSVAGARALAALAIVCTAWLLI
ncbi:hypothetical protein GGR56DRAFT_693809 [Xylariaceae sp. FL0804]|nr:hypothetical protein GGR56DRAFT_693809 [Xylariaceae sp. FL0804]